MRVLFVALLATVLSACASAGGTGGSSSRNVITAEDLANVAENASVYDAIERLRPQWLQPVRNVGTGERTPPQAWMDERQLGELEAFRQQPVRFVTEIRYLPASETVTRYGAGAGVIMVFTRARS